MKRSLTVTLAGEEVTMAATFAAMEVISEKVADPLLIAREAALEAVFERMGQVYDARFKMTVGHVAKILHIGLTAAGDKRDLAAVKELAFDHGLIAARGIALQYLSLIEPQTEEAGTSEGDGGSGE